MKQHFYELIIVKTRIEHPCIVCEETIPKGTLALVENGCNKTEGFYRNYFHRQGDSEYGCHDAYIDCMQPNNPIVEKIKDPTFHGQIQYNRWKND